MRTVALILTVLLSGCLTPVRNTWAEQNIPAYDGRYDGKWYTRAGIAHVAVTIPIVLGSEVVLGNPYLGAAFACGGYLFREVEETSHEEGRRYEWGVWDSVGDVLSPCISGAILSRLLR